MSRIVFTLSSGDEYEIDEFYKSLMFQRIMDGDFSRNERDVLLVILRKTLYFNKTSDRLGNYWLSRAVGIGQDTLKKTVKQLEAKGLLDIVRSKGGYSSTSSMRFNSFSLGSELLLLVLNNWIDIKEDNDFDV